MKDISDGEQNLIKTMQDMWECGMEIPALIVSRENFKDMMDFHGFVIDNVGDTWWECDFGKLRLILKK